jgi:abhydrolase domain-containing protein 12
MAAGTVILLILKYGAISIAAVVGLYACLLGLLAIPSIQAHVVYLHAIQMTWFKDLNVPEMFGFLHNQATSFSIKLLMAKLCMHGIFSLLSFIANMSK